MRKNNIKPLKTNTPIWVKKAGFFSVVVLCLTPFLSAPLALLAGIGFAWFVGHPYPQHNHKITQLLLQFSVIGLGFGMNMQTAVSAGKSGLLFTVFSIVGTLFLGYFVGKLLKINLKISYLITAGTAICGGSAIAAIAPVIKAGDRQISIALATVFILNSVALLLFPFLGHLFNLSQQQFGLWCAIAIHDTSSVVGAAAKFGNEALAVATTVKLARALWIIPLAFFSLLIFKSKGVKIKLPYFIGGFVIAILLNTYSPFFQSISSYIVYIAKCGLMLTIFLIGCGLSKEVLFSTGLKPVLQGIFLWVFISLVTLVAILSYI